METITAIIVDDESSGREILRELLRKIAPNVEVVAEANAVGPAIEAIAAHKPALLFLDVEMPTGTGFDVLEGVQSRSFEVIFITAHQEYALEAFRHASLDYLLKPINVRELKAAVERAAAQLALKNQNDRINLLLNEVRKPHGGGKIALPTSKGFQLHMFEDIVRCESDRNYTRFYKTDGTAILVSKTMKEFEQALTTNGFFRVHRSHIINLSHVLSYHKGKGGEVHMVDGSILDVSRDKKEALIQLLT